MNKPCCLGFAVLVPFVSLAGGIIDTSTEKSISASLKGESPADVEIINKLVCDAGHGLDPRDPKAKALALERLRTRLQGKTVRQVAAEVRTQQGEQTAEFHATAQKLVLERQTRWQKRREGVAAVTVGSGKDTVIRLLGEPDAKSGADTIEHWLYRYDASQHGDQIWIDALAIQMSGGTVSKITPLGERHQVEDLAKPTQK